MKPAEEKKELDIFGWRKVQVEYATAINDAYHLGLKHGAEDMRKRAAQVLDAAFAGVLEGHGIKPNHRTFKLMDDLATTTADLILLLPMEDK